jgi:hypothetical protein
VDMDFNACINEKKKTLKKRNDAIDDGPLSNI